MGGYIYFGHNYGYAAGSGVVGFIGYYWWPYIYELSPDVAYAIYSSFDHSDDINFDYLTPQVYTLCYKAISRAFDEDLRGYPYMIGHKRYYILDEWDSEIKVKMTESYNFASGLLDNEMDEDIITNFMNTQDPNVRQMATDYQKRRLLDRNQLIFWMQVYAEDYYPILRDFQNHRYDKGCLGLNSFMRNYESSFDVALTSLTARLVLQKARCERSLDPVRASNTYKTLIDEYYESKEESLVYLVEIAREEQAIPC